MRCYIWLYKHSLSLCPCMALVKSLIDNHYPSIEAVAASSYGGTNTLNTLNQCLVIVWLYHNFQIALLKQHFFLCLLLLNLLSRSVPPVNPNLLPAHSGKTCCQAPMGSQHSPPGSTAAWGSCRAKTPGSEAVCHLETLPVLAPPLIISAPCAWPGSKVSQVCCAQAWKKIGSKWLQVQLSYNVTCYSCSANVWLD